MKRVLNTSHGADFPKGTEVEIVSVHEKTGTVMIVPANDPDRFPITVSIEDVD